MGLLVNLVGRPAWLLGLLADGAAFILQFLALGHGSLLLVQPLLVSGLLFALPIGARLAHKRLSGTEWLGAAEVVVGLSLFLVVASPGLGRLDVSGLAWGMTALATLAPTVLLIIAAPAGHGPGRAAMLGAASGIAYGLAAALTQAVSTELVRRGAVHVLLTWQLYALVVAGLGTLLLVQSAFQAAPLRCSLPILTVVDPVVSVLIGSLAFGEQIHSSAIDVVLEVVGMLILSKGVFLLGRSPLVAGNGDDTQRTPT